MRNIDKKRELWKRDNSFNGRVLCGMHSGGCYKKINYCDLGSATIDHIIPSVGLKTYKIDKSMQYKISKNAGAFSIFEQLMCRKCNNEDRGNMMSIYNICECCKWTVVRKECCYFLNWQRYTETASFMIFVPMVGVITDKRDGWSISPQWLSYDRRHHEPLLINSHICKNLIPRERIGSLTPDEAKAIGIDNFKVENGRANMLRFLWKDKNGNTGNSIIPFYEGKWSIKKRGYSNSTHYIAL